MPVLPILNKLIQAKRDYKTPLLIFALAFLARVVFFVLAWKYYADAWNPEKIGINHWLDIARNLASGQGFSHSSLLTYLPMGGGVEPTAARSPVPVLVLSAVLLIFKSHSYYALFAQSWFFSSLSAALLYVLAEKVFSLSPSAAILNPSPVILSETKDLLLTASRINSAKNLKNQILRQKTPAKSRTSNSAERAESISFRPQDDKRNLLNSAPLLISLFYCFYLPEIYISTTYAAGSESLFTFLLMSYFYLIIRQMENRSLKLAFAAGLVLGLAFLSRPIVLFLPLLYAGWGMWKYRSKAVPSIAAYLAAFILCVSPWVIRNQIVMGKPILTTTLGGYNLLRHNWLISRGQYRLCTAEDFQPIVNQTIREASGGNKLDFPLTLALSPKGAREKVTNSRNKVLTEVQLDEMFTRKAKEIIRQYPWRYLKFTAIRSVWLWYKIGAEKPPYIFWNILIYLFMFPGLLLVLARRHLLSLFAAHIFYFILMHIGINAQFRFICPMMPYGIMIAFYAAFVLLTWIPDRRFRG